MSADGKDKFEIRDFNNSIIDTIYERDYNDWTTAYRAACNIADELGPGHEIWLYENGRFKEIEYKVVSK